ncbi:Leucine_rich repeats-containing protein [Hexamita inflata]|uniref:Leucine rich repeats-containing protein n=1 Tax=Hexamita inflata TaxID=28002 RepID=A0AA86RUB1_9EUKA|nr:Leucine rich repeats-containing protein [Hexamita inflata]
MTSNATTWITVDTVDQLRSKEIQQKQYIWIESIIHSKLDYVPMNVKYLTIRLCNLLSLKELKNITSLQYLDISFNPVFGLKEIEVHKKLVTLIIQNTMIMDVSQVSELPCLTEFNAENCFILNALPIVDHPNFALKWLSKQQVPDKDHTQIQTRYTKKAEQETQDLFNFEMAKKPESDYMVKMIERYGPQVKDGKIVVENDQEVTHFRFVDCIRATSASFNKCFNILFQNTPTKLKKLTITNSNLTSIDGVQKIATLEYLDVSNNLLMFIEPIKTLTNLQQVFVDGNMLHDLEVIKNLPNFTWNPVQKQKQATIEDYKIVLKEQYSEQKANELMQQLKINEEQECQFIYDTLMASQYRQIVKGKVLKITNNDKVRSFQFTEYLYIEELNIQNCINVNFTRTPKSIKKLTVNNCQLTTAKIQGLEQMKQITDLNLGLNSLTDDSLQIIGSLNNLISLVLSMNMLTNINNIGNLTNLKVLDLNYNLLKDLNNIEKLKQLENLDVSYNQLDQINEIEDLTYINTLNVSNNNLYSIQYLSKLINLVYLNISHNNIISVEICKTFNQLVDFRTHENKIQDLYTIMSHPNCQQIWQTSQNQIMDKDYQSACLNTNQISNLKNGQKYRLNNDKMLFKHQGSTDNNELVIKNDNEVMNLLFADVNKVKKITAENCENIIFDMAPVYVQILSVRNSKLKSITNIYQMEQITDLDLSYNLIRDISELGALVNMIRLNLSFNDIYRIDVLKELNKLQYLNLSNNKILLCEPLKNLGVTELQINKNLINDLDFITNMKNFQLIWVCTYSHLHEPVVINYQNYLGENFGTVEAAQKMMNTLENQRKEVQEIVADSQIFSNCSKDIQNNSLFVENSAITNIRFADQLNINKLTLMNCNNLKFERVSKKVKDLRINHCNLCHVQGIEKMQQLTQLNLDNNKIIFIEQVAQLKNLQYFTVKNNFVQDFQFKSECVSYQNTPTQKDYENYIKHTKLNLSVQQVINIINEKSYLNNQLKNDIDKYDSDMKQYLKYNQIINNQVLTIQNNEKIKSLQFIDQFIEECNQAYIEITSVLITQCVNVNFSRSCSSTLKSLSLINCQITKICGIQQMYQLEILDMSANRLRNIAELNFLIKLQTLNLSKNQLNDDSKLSLPSLTKLDVSNNQIQCLNVILNCENLSLLDLSQNQLVDISQIHKLKKLTELNLSFNNIQSISEIKFLKQLTSLNLNNNEILFIYPIAQMTRLNTISAEYNYIQDFDTVQNCGSSIAYYQKKLPENYNFQNYVRSTKSIFTGEQIINKIQTKKEENDRLINTYNNIQKLKCQMVSKFRSLVNKQGNNALQIADCMELANLDFSDDLEVKILHISNCLNVQFFQTPIKVIKLSVVNCQLKSIKGIEKMTQLQYLDLQSNSIEQIDLLRSMVNLQELNLQNNKIQRFQALNDHPNRDRYQLDNQQVDK